MYLPFDQDWNDLERGHYSIRTRINAGGPKCGHYSNDPMDNKVKPGALGQILHSLGDHRWEGDPNKSIFLLTHDRNGLRMGQYSSLHAFVSFKIAYPDRYKSQHNIATTKIRKEV